MLYTIAQDSRNVTHDPLVTMSYLAPSHIVIIGLFFIILVIVIIIIIIIILFHMPQDQNF